MLMPKRVKRRKQFRGTMKGKALRGNTISYGEYGIVATEPCWIRSNQIEAARVAMTRYIKRGGKVWFEIEHVEKDNPPQDLIALNPNQSVPTLVDRELTYHPKKLFFFINLLRARHPLGFFISAYQKNNRSHDCSIDLSLFKDRLGYPSFAISDLNEDAIAWWVNG